MRYAMRLPANDVLERRIEDQLTRPRGRPSHAPLVRYRSSRIRPPLGTVPAASSPRSSTTSGSGSPAWASSSTTLTGAKRAIVRLYNQRGTAEQWIKQGKTATHWTRLSCHRLIQDWSLTSLQQRLLKTGGRLIRHARYFTLQLAESYLTGALFRQILSRIERLGRPPT